MRHCVQGASRSSRNPGAVCGSLWYHKMSASQRRKALAREGKKVNLEENMRRVSTWEGPVEIDHSPNGALVFYLPPRSHGKGGAFSPSEARRLGEALTDEARAAERAKNTQTVRRTIVRENPSTGLWVVGGLALAAAAFYFLNKNKTASAATATGPLPPPPAPLPPAVSCVIDQQRLSLWGATAGVAAFYAPMLAITDPVSAGLVVDILPSEIRNQVAPLSNTTQLVIVDQNDTFHYFASGTTPSVRRDDLQADYCNKYGGTLAGHPANMFMVM